MTRLITAALLLAAGLPAADGELNVKDFGARGEGTDDTDALQAAIDNASSKNRPIYVPPGDYVVTRPLEVKSNVSMRGAGRSWGSALRPRNTALFRIDGAGKVGGWVFRIKIFDLLVYGGEAGEQPALVILRNSYNVELSNLFFHDVAAGSTVQVASSNAIVLRDLVSYGQVSGPERTGLAVDGSSVEIHNPHLQLYSTGLKVTRNATVSVFGPAIERCAVGILHQAAEGGSATVHGGRVSSEEGYAIGVFGHNLSVFGTRLDSYRDGKLGL